MDARLKSLTEQLEARAPADGITDAEIDSEVRAVRRAAQSTESADFEDDSPS